MLSRPPTRLELTQADVDEYNELREFAEEARAGKRTRETDDSSRKEFAAAAEGGSGGTMGGTAADRAKERRRRVGL